MAFIFLEFQQLFLMLSATTILAIACIKRNDLYLFLLAYSILTFGVFFRSFIFIAGTLDVVANIGYVISMFVTSAAVFNDYYLFFIKNKEKSTPKKLSYLLILQLLVFSSEILILVLGFINIVLIVKIYWKKRTATYAFIGLSIGAAFVSILFTVFYSLGVEWSYEFSEGIDNIMYTLLLVTGIIALLENRIKESEIRYRDAYKTSEFYKDLIAHDTANILQNMGTSLDIASIYMKDLKDHKEISNLIQNIEEQIYRGKNLIYNVRTITDFETGTYSTKKIDMNMALHKVLDFISESYTEKKINFKIDVKRNSHFIKANDFILNVFENIIINAIKHNDNEEIKIKINLEKIKKDHKKFVRIEFIDNGRGIRDQIKKEIFNREYSNKDILKRRSLGLYLVKNIVESFGGRIRVENRVENDHTQGSNFIILFPAID